MPVLGRAMEGSGWAQPATVFIWDCLQGAMTFIGGLQIYFMSTSWDLKTGPNKPRQPPLKAMAGFSVWGQIFRGEGEGTVCRFVDLKKKKGVVFFFALNLDVEQKVSGKWNHLFLRNKIIGAQ